MCKEHVILQTGYPIWCRVRLDNPHQEDIPDLLLRDMLSSSVGRSLGEQSLVPSPIVSSAKIIYDKPIYKGDKSCI